MRQDLDRYLPSAQLTIPMQVKIDPRHAKFLKISNHL